MKLDTLDSGLRTASNLPLLIQRALCLLKINMIV